MLFPPLVFRLGAEDSEGSHQERKREEEKHILTLYQAMAIFEGANESSLTLNINDTVKVLDKNDHGIYYS